MEPYHASEPVNQERPGRHPPGASGRAATTARSRASLWPSSKKALGPPEPLTPDDVLKEVQRLTLQTPSEAAKLIRADRDVR